MPNAAAVAAALWAADFNARPRHGPLSLWERVRVRASDSEDFPVSVILGIRRLTARSRPTFGRCPERGDNTYGSYSAAFSPIGFVNPIAAGPGTSESVLNNGR